ncbi:isoaspartyl peptidase/L-asparaginase family protein [[Eubacterium] cellulosolvens]
MKPSIIVHGGAWNIPPELSERSVKGCEKAAHIGWAVLEKGGKAIDAVEKAVNVMEDDPIFNAGRGAYPNEIGEIELDALIMEGEELRAGAVAAICNVKNPVSVARKVLDATNHVLLVGKGANIFAKKCGFKEYASSELVTKFIPDKKSPMWNQFEEVQHGTVGAVAIDQKGNLSAATSTGGTLYKAPGRVGDSPLIGCGAYADNDVGAASATGWGESIMRVILAKTACSLLENGIPSADAAKQSITLLRTKVQGVGGIIMIDPRGQIGCSYNSGNMPYAYSVNGNLTSGI